MIDHVTALLKITERKVVVKNHSDPLDPLEFLDPLNLLNRLVRQEREDPTSDQLDQRIKPVGNLISKRASRLDA
ncbi:MAG: hypothetical protein EBV11_05705, partial [Actinobacteria bacterium]|nr:hypothetical protein [Actinomycetota bacterium]